MKLLLIIPWKPILIAIGTLVVAVVGTLAYLIYSLPVDDHDNMYD